jgi:putative colanic acid biosynthesis acetyltransferase WcaF
VTLREFKSPDPPTPRQADEPTQLDIAANRRAPKWTGKELAKRLLWDLAQPAFAWSPRQIWGWRNVLLRLFGAHVGRNVRIYPTVKIAVPWTLSIADGASVGDHAILYSLGSITLGASASISQYAHLCAGSHDYRQSDLPLLKLPISIAEGAWVCAEAFVGPGVNVGAYAIVGARAMANRNVDAWTIVLGNPAQVVGVRPPFHSA